MTVQPGGTTQRQRRRLITILVITALLGLGCFVACKRVMTALDPESRAHDQAVKLLREKATGSRDEITWALRKSTRGEDPAAVLNRAKLTVEQSSAHTGTVFGAAVVTDGLLRLDVAFAAKEIAGGGITYADVTLRACVRMEGKAGATSTVNMRDVPCDPKLPDYDEEYGTVFGVAKVAD
jgi:hypothetical protein